MTQADHEDARGADEGSDGSERARLAALERQVARLHAEMGELRSQLRAAPREGRGSAPSARTGLARLLRRPVAPHPSISGEEIESLVGRYGTLAFAGLAILMAVGALIKFAVSHGLLTPEVRVSFGALVAAAVGGAGLYFRRRGEVRYGDMLLALSLAIVDLVAWGAGPRLHLISTGAALVIVDLVAIALGMLARHHGAEFLFAVAVAGALSAPFVTAEEAVAPLTLLAYASVVLLSALRGARDPRWRLAFAVLVVGAVVYALAVASQPLASAWYAPYLIVSFAALCALGALVLARPEWRGDLARAYLAVGLIGILIGWDRIAAESSIAAYVIALGIAGVTYVALWARRPTPARLWAVSALVLPLLSIGIALAATSGVREAAAVYAAWALIALAAWVVERKRGEGGRGGVHLLMGALLGTAAVATGLWRSPLGMVVGLAAWGVVLALLVREEPSVGPLIGVAVALGGAASSAIDQLASRADFSYVPFFTRSSASALAAALGIGLAGELISRGEGVAASRTDRTVRLGLLAAFLILWGRMELAGAFGADLAAFLLISYYAACGVASIVAGRRLGVSPLRLAGLGLAIYAALKAVVEATDIGGILLRVGAYGAVGVFLLGAGYLYRERGPGAVDAS